MARRKEEQNQYADQYKEEPQPDLAAMTEREFLEHLNGCFNRLTHHLETCKVLFWPGPDKPRKD